MLFASPQQGQSLPLECPLSSPHTTIAAGYNLHAGTSTNYNQELDQDAQVLIKLQHASSRLKQQITASLGEQNCSLRRYTWLYLHMLGVPACALATWVSRPVVLTIQSLELSSPLCPWDAIVPRDMA